MPADDREYSIHGEESTISNTESLDERTEVSEEQTHIKSEKGRDNKITQDGVATRSQRISVAAKLYYDGYGSGAIDNNDELAWADDNNYNTIVEREFARVCAGLGGGFDYTSELHAVKFDQTMKSPNKNHLEKAFVQEYKRMQKHNVFEAVPT